MTKHKYLRVDNRKFEILSDTPAIAVSQNSKYLMPGQEIEITVLVCGNRDRIDKVSIGGVVVSITKNGTAILGLPGGSVGKHKIDVDITFIDSNGKLQLKTYSIEYEVGQACSVIDEGNLNLLYIGVDNLLYISASGGSDDETTATIKSGGSSITKSGPNKYIARVSTVSEECIVSVYVNDRITGAKRFRAVNLPDPRSTIDGYVSGSRMPANEFWNQPGIRVAIPDFPFKVSYKVIGYTIKIIGDSSASKSIKCSSSQFPPDLKKSISPLKPGSVVIIDDMIVEEPGGRKIKVPATVYFID